MAHVGSFRGQSSILYAKDDLWLFSCGSHRCSRMIALMADREQAGKARLVYSTDVGRVCPGCGWPVRDCTCSQKVSADAPIPRRIVARLRMEKKGRGGKTVTVVDGLPQNAAFLKDLCQDLKRACGTGGAVLEGGAVELQGDLRARLRAFLLNKGFVVRG